MPAHVSRATPRELSQAYLKLVHAGTASEDQAHGAITTGVGRPLLLEHLYAHKAIE